MNDGSSMSAPTQGDEDDWETADIAIPSNINAKANAPTLRPSAPEFKPRPAAAPARTSKFPEAGPSAHGGGSLHTRDGVTGGEDEWFGSRRPASNRQIWDSANAAQPAIMLASTAQANVLASSLGPPTPTMQILRRPNDHSSSNKRGSAEDARRAKTLGEREEEYRLARERIFGGEMGIDGDTGGTKAGSRSGSGRSSPVVLETSLGVVPSQVRRSPGPRVGAGAGAGVGAGVGNGVVRQPKGPEEGGGFGGR